MTQQALRQKKTRRGSVSSIFLVAVVLLNTPPLVFAEILQNLHYGYDDAGNVARIGDQITLPNTQTLTYDDLDRLLTANGPYGTGGANSTFTYAYNEIGNMTVNPQVGTYTYPASNPTTVRPHAAIVAGPYPITYDNNGNVLTMTDPTGFFGYNATYNTDNRPSSVTTIFASVPTTSTFIYDGDGGRVKKIVGNTTTRYISKLYECETTGANTSCSRFIWAGDTRIATVAVTSGTVHYWHGDHLGSSSMITDSTGAKVQALSYYPYGDIRVNQSSATPPVDMHYKYTGKELDSSSNLYFYESRYYHAVFGRFVSPDSIVPNFREPQDLNRYTYARNNPMLYTDPSGHCPICIGIGIGILIGVVSSGIQSDWDLKATLIGGVIGGASAGIGAGVASSVYSATLSALGSTWAGVAGGAVGGAAAGGTSAVLANAAGYRVNIGLAIASGAAAGGITGGAYGRWGELGALAAAPVAGASAAAISGADPGVGALIAASTAAFSLGVKYSINGRQSTLEPGRALTSDEIAEARFVFGQKINYSGVKIFNEKYFFLQGSNYVMAPDGNIYWPNECGNLAVCGGYGTATRFIHEMTHVLQAQHGVNVLWQGFLLQAAKYLTLTLSDPYSYTYDPNRSFRSYNIEQQGSIAEGIYGGKHPNNIDY